MDALGRNVPDAKFHFYADDTVIYCCGSTLAEALRYLQTAFNHVERQLIDLKLVLNVSKTKFMILSNGRKIPEPPPSVSSLQGNLIELVTCYKYLGVLIDDQLSFKSHSENLVKKLKLKLGFFYRNRTCFSFAARKKLVAATFLPVLDYGDLLYMHAPVNCLNSLDSVYHGALRFITGCRALTHHCTLYGRVEWPSLAARRLSHWHIFIYKAILGLLPNYLCVYISRTQNPIYNLRSNDRYELSVPRMRTEFGKQSFMFSAPKAWNLLQDTLNLRELISLGRFKNLMRNIESASYRSCSC